MDKAFGKVFLIGAGPGDEELLTIKAMKSLKKCTAVMYDRLVGGNILKHLKEDAVIYYCGKEPGCHYKSQDEINDMLVKLAKEGHIVGRVKGGDPYVFGRGGEEALRLVEEGIEFETVPGVTSPISVLNYAGIPITHRGLSQSFHIYTGMSAHKLNINWRSAATSNGTLVFLMGLDSLEEITTKLLENGIKEDTKAVVIMRGTTSKQKKVTGNIKDIVNKVKKAELKSPCIIAFGEVVGLSEKLNWYEKKPLFGVNICVTRSKEQSEKLTKSLIDLGAEILEIHSIKIKESFHNVKNIIDKLEEYSWIVLTSVNAVNLFFNFLKKSNYDIRKIKGDFAVIGKATEEALLDKGIFPKIKAEEFHSENLSLALKKVLKKEDKVLIPASSKSNRTISKSIKDIVSIVDEVSIYSPEVGEAKNPKAFEEVDIVLYTSPSTVKNMIDIMGIEKIKAKKALAIGPVTEKELIKNGITPFVCEIHTAEGMKDKLLELKYNKKI